MYKNYPYGQLWAAKGSYGQLWAAIGYNLSVILITIQLPFYIESWKKPAVSATVLRYPALINA